MIMEKKTARVEAFSDGIFGVAITLLAIEIGIGEYHDATNSDLWKRILEKWPEYFAYLNSLATVLLIWIGHHKIFNKIWKTSQSTLMINGLVLMLVALFPFPTKTAGTFIGTDAANTAVAFYAGFTGFIVLSMLLLNLSIVKNESCITDPVKHLPWFRHQIKQQVSGIAVYAIASGIAFVSPGVSLVLTFAMWVYWAVVTRDVEDEK